MGVIFVKQCRYAAQISPLHHTRTADISFTPKFIRLGSTFSSPEQVTKETPVQSSGILRVTATINSERSAHCCPVTQMRQQRVCSFRWLIEPVIITQQFSVFFSSD
jgi:hypothetical protein